MVLVLIPFVLLFFSVYLSDAQQHPIKGCSPFRSIIICRGRLPNGKELQNAGIQTLVMLQLPEGTRLSLKDPQSFASGIQKIDIQNSFIDTVESGYFAHVGKKNNLKRLSLRNIEGSAAIDRTVIQGLEQSLNYLTVVNGLTVNIADLADIVHLTNLELDNTTIVGSSADFAKLLPELRSLSVQNCNLSQLPWEALAKWIAKDSLRRLKIHGSKWNCDCSMMKLKGLQSGFVENNLHKLTCSGPPNLAGKQLSELTENDLCPMVDPKVKTGNNNDSLKASGSTSSDRADGIDSDNGIEATGGLQVEENQEVNGTALRAEVIAAGTVVGVLVLIFVVFVVVYKCRLYPKNTNKEERTSRTHENKRYVNVIEEPPLQQNGDGDQNNGNGKPTKGVSL